ncbi:polysaccharide biosynthesis protein [Falsiroseomonas selenitidurans]|uniref:Polysaccharide biosynthesis protein n=1 Tax=Falsiroseomonas selenitidurans TaxID=2716335 RepID=A0ABX1EAQ9_9PROT|nr:nucleoside-diphosphate sugar epimerase/dehydratase [Falsiroseomonas selenitidurans]NKC33913.1 polysaccharide biosynthesis protein [Falsiroseomonas selenitidurans]
MAASARDRILLNLALDALVAALALPGAVWLAAPGQWPPGPWWLGAVPAAAACLLLAGLPLRMPWQYWRFASLPELLASAGAALGGAVLFATLLHLAGAWRPGNPGFAVIHALVLAALLAVPRVIARLRHAGRAGPLSETPAQPALLVGAGDGADLFIRALAQERSPAYRVVGILAQRSRQLGRRIQGLPILGTAEDAAAVLDGLREEGRLPAVIILATPAMQGVALQRLLDAADRHGVPVKRAPRLTALGPASRRPGERAEPEQRVRLRPVEIEDLLDRPQVPLDREGMARLVQGKRVLVTGAGGTIGGELARQVAALGPASLTLLDHGEYVLYEIDLELRERHPAVPRRAVLADVRDAERIGRLFSEIRPELVFHAAALKHVPMVENDPLEGLLTNAAGTRVVADAARAAGCGLMVFISTDKAVNPTSVMGASKRLAEMYCQARDREARLAGAGMRLVTVRFGNVLGSTGSVVPLFRRQLERGGPLTVTHPDMRRYFMTVREAVGLVLQASVVGATDRTDQPKELREGGIFVLDMGEPVKIVDLARRMIRLAGLRPEEDVEIRFTGLRPGEKLFEELFHGQEPPQPTNFAGLLVAVPRTTDAVVMGQAIDEIAGLAGAGDGAAALARLSALVPEFAHEDGTGSVT